LYPFTGVFGGDGFVILRPSEADLLLMGAVRCSFSIEDYRQPLPVMTVELPPSYVNLMDHMFNTHIGAYYMTVSHVPGQRYISCIYWNGKRATGSSSRNLGTLFVSSGTSMADLDELLDERQAHRKKTETDKGNLKKDSYLYFLSASCLNYLFLSNLAGIEKVKTKPDTLTINKLHSWKKNKHDPCKQSDAMAALAAPSVLYKINHSLRGWEGKEDAQRASESVTEVSPFVKTGYFKKSFYGVRRERYRWSFREPNVSLIGDALDVRFHKGAGGEDLGKPAFGNRKEKSDGI